MKFKSLRTKVLVWFGGITIFILFIFNGAFYYFLEENIKLSIQNKLYDKAVFINDNIILGMHIDKLLKDERLASFDIVVVKDDKVIYKKGKINYRYLQPFVESKKSFFVFEQANNLNGLYVFRMTNPFDGAILFQERNIDEEINTKLQEVRNAFFIVEPMLLLLLLFVANKLITKLLKPIVNITKTAQNISVTDLSKTINTPTDDDEIKKLVDAFNSMIRRLEGEVEHIEQFNSDVSHELKTPLTVIKGEIEITLNKLRDAKYYKKSLGVIEYEATQIQIIVDNLLMLTKYTKANIEQTFTLSHIDSILLDTIKQYNMQLKDRNIKLHLEKFESIELNINTQLISTIFSNLIDNAIKYSNNDTNIYISLYKKDKVCFIIKDEGIGIAEENLSKILNRFYRIDESRNKKIKGFGLGLSIVKNSIELHNGTIEIQSEVDVGTEIKVIL